MECRHRLGNFLRGSLVARVVLVILCCIFVFMLQKFALRFLVLEGFASSLSDNSLKNIDPNEIVIVLFHVPWCGHCKKFVPQWPKITEGLPDDINGVNVKTVKIDCEERKDLAKKYGIRAFPTIKFLYQNQVIKHIGDRTLSGIKSKLESVANI